MNPIEIELSFLEGVALLASPCIPPAETEKNIRHLLKLDKKEIFNGEQ